MLHDVMNQVWHNTNFIDSQFLGKDPLNDSEDFGSPDLAASAAPYSSQLFASQGIARFRSPVATFTLGRCGLRCGFPAGWAQFWAQ